MLTRTHGRKCPGGSRIVDGIGEEKQHRGSVGPPLPPLAGSRRRVRLTVRLTPKSSADAIGAVVEGPEGPHLHVKVCALPADGAANAALQSLVAKWIGLAQRDVSLAGGGKSRLKTLHLSGDPAELDERLGRRLGDPQQQVTRGLRS